MGGPLRQEYVISGCVDELGVTYGRRPNRLTAATAASRDLRSRRIPDWWISRCFWCAGGLQDALTEQYTDHLRRLHADGGGLPQVLPPTLEYAVSRAESCST